MNARGLRYLLKRKSLFLYCKGKGTNFYFVQETHSSNEDERFWRSHWGNNIWFAHGSLPRAVVGLMDRALDLKPEVTQGCGFKSRLLQEVHDCSPGAAQSAAHCSKCVHLDGLNAENTFHYSV